MRDGRVTTEEVSLEAGHSTSVSVGEADAVWVRPTRGSVHAAALVVGGDDAREARAASVPVRPSRVAVRDIEVVRRR
ncbi:hypothetical protein [Janibacter sp. DB-40]|uniref:hypothetical protein n=1 Tax=Janibacter sp. DB-40 TaxID=3028808 RepID=UPI0024076FD4|nr:hypothetical protein [Janibacter sp. DB-40]